MFVIFGWGYKTSKDCGPTLPMKCGNCGKHIYGRLLQVQEWFSLFFAPIIPYKSSYFLICTECSRSNEIPNDLIESVKQLNKHTVNFLNKKIPEDEYQNHLKLSGLFNNERVNPNNNWECPNCSQGNLNTAYKCQHCGYEII